MPISKWNKPRTGELDRAHRKHRYMQYAPLTGVGLRRMAESLRRPFIQGVVVVKNNIGKDDLTPEVIKAAKEEMNDSTRNMSACFYLTWSRRRK